MEFGTIQNRFVKTSKTAVNLRPEKNRKASLGQIKKGTPVYLIRQELDDQDELWAFVNYNGQEGYIAWDCIEIDMTIEQSEAYNNSLPSPMPNYTEEDLLPPTTPAPTLAVTPEPPVPLTPTPEPTPAPTPEPIQLPTADSIGTGAVINQYGVVNFRIPFRSDPYISDNIYRFAEPGEYVFMIRNVAGPKDGKIWTLVNIRGQEGYILSECIDVIGQEASEAYAWQIN